jgi:hypothetical protein
MIHRRGALVWLFACAALHAQTTQGLISGRVVDSRTGSPLAGASITYTSTAGPIGGTASSDRTGYFILPLLTPGFYRLRVEAGGYQAQEVQQVELAVAGRLDFNFRLRASSDVWEAGQYRSVFLPNSDAIVTFYGPDVDTSRSSAFTATRGGRSSLEQSISQVIDSNIIRDLPFNGRDVYTMLVTQPGVTADSGTARGLGLAINGQRPSASNFLLDGLENNNNLVTGPLSVVAPEAVQEYRVSTSNFSAEYGRTSGYLANAVSRSGGNAWHGVGYYYFKNEKFNANGFQQNAHGIPRAPLKESQPGFFAGGPVKRNTLFASASLEYYRFRSFSDPETYSFPTTVFVPLFTAPGSLARRLLEQYPAPPVTDGVNPTAKLTLLPPTSVNRWLSLPRIDYVRRGGAERILARATIARLDRPDFSWTPYKDFVGSIDQKTTGIGGTWVRSFRPNLTSEARIGYNDDDLFFDRPHPEIPTLSAEIVLPGSYNFYEYRNHGRTLEIVENLILARGRHIVKMGGGFLRRNLDGFQTSGRDGLYTFLTAVDFAIDQPLSLLAYPSRADLAAGRRVLPDYNRDYRYHQFFLFAQDSIRIRPALVLNLGIRYENLGAPENVGSAKDAFLRLGSGSTLGDRLAGAAFVVPPSGAQKLYDSDNNDLAVRAGFSYSPGAESRVVFRGSYGVFYDRPFENLWQNLRSNNFIETSAFIDQQFNYLRPITQALASVPFLDEAASTIKPLLYQPGLRNAYVHSYFGGVQLGVSENLTAEVTALGSLGHKLITTDQINRALSVPDGQQGPGNTNRYFNPTIREINYRANQGFARYQAIAASARYRGSGLLGQVSYTYSRTTDNQSEPLRGDFFNLSFTRIGSDTGLGRASFSRQFDSAGDRGNSEFDQRHNFVVFGVWDVPAFAGSTKLGVLGRDWKISGLAAARTGFPFTVRAPSGFTFTGESVTNNRANLIDASRVFQSPVPVVGGVKLLNPAAFSAPARGVRGDSERNAFHGPGFYNVDLSLARTIALPWLGEAVRVQLRADAFNLLNHTNLGPPDALFNPAFLDNFGVALRGRSGRDTGFPATAPLNETSRQFQFLLRFEF